MYGALFAPHRRAITGNDYVQLLEKVQPQMDWDAESEESFFEFTDGDVEVEVWYPSLYSIKYSRPSKPKLTCEETVRFGSGF